MKAAVFLCIVGVVFYARARRKYLALYEKLQSCIGVYDRMTVQITMLKTQRNVLNLPAMDESISAAEARRAGVKLFMDALRRRYLEKPEGELKRSIFLLPPPPKDPCSLQSN